MIRNGCSQAERPAALPRLALCAVWYVDADASYQVTRRMMVQQGGDIVALRTVSGVGTLRLTNGKSLVLPQGSLLFVSKARIAFYGCKHNQWRFYWLEFQTIDPVDLPCETVLELPIAAGEEFEMQRCYDMLRGTPESAMSVLSQSLFLFLITDWLYRKSFEPVTAERKTDEILLLLSQGIRDHLTVAELAKKACLCERSFRALVKRHVGKSPKEYMLNDMLTSAFMLLRTTNRTITDIAQSVGFDSASCFTRAFQNRFGLSPSKARWIKPADLESEEDYTLPE